MSEGEAKVVRMRGEETAFCEEVLGVMDRHGGELTVLQMVGCLVSLERYLLGGGWE